MQNLNHWMQFENTGRVEDYLAYCAGYSQGIHEECIENVISRNEGMNSYAGIPMGNRNHIKTDAYR